MSLVETDLRVFQRAEHEWLRIAAMAAPDWEALRTLGRLAGFDWRYLWNTAGLHQLDGVVSWRCLAEEVADLVPGEVRGRCREHVNALNAGPQDEWLGVIAKAFEALNRDAVSWVTPGGPAQYLPLGMLPHAWPRRWKDAEVLVSPVWLDAAIAAVESAGFTEVPIPHGGGTYWVRGDFYIDIQCKQHRRRNYPDRVSVDIAGTQVWLPPREWLVCLMAQRAICNYVHGKPLALWQIARLAPWGHGVTSEDLRHAVTTGDNCADCGGGGLTWREETLWGVAMASRVYGLSLPAGLGPVQPLRPFPTWGHYERKVILRVPPWPSDETVLFDPRFREGTDERIAEGHWTRENEEDHPDLGRLGTG